MTTASGATEYKLQFSDRGGLEELSGHEADARRIQTVLFGHQMAGMTEFGLEVQKYLFEFSDSSTLEEIQDRATSLIALYCPGVRVLGLVVQRISAANDPSGRGTNSIVIGISLGRDDAPAYDFGLAASNTAGGLVVSTLKL